MANPNCDTLFFYLSPTQQCAHQLILSLQELEVEQDLALVLCSQQLGMHEDGLEDILTKVATVMADTTFMKQVLDINSVIEEMSEDN